MKSDSRSVIFNSPIGVLIRNRLNPGWVFSIRPIIAASVLVAAFGCAATSPEQGGPTAAELDAMGEKAVATLLEKQPEAQEALDQSIGIVVINMKATKVPWVGAGSGYGVVIDNRTGARSYIRISRFEVGGGYGAQKYQVIIVFSDEKLLDRAAQGAWHYEAGAEVAAGDASTEIGKGSGGVGVPKKSGKGYVAFKLAEGGAVATVTVRMAYAKPYLKNH